MIRTNYATCVFGSIFRKYAAELLTKKKKELETIMQEIQNIYKCRNYTENTNLNLTCENKNRCVIYYDTYCQKYKEGTENANNRRYINK